PAVETLISRIAGDIAGRGDDGVPLGTTRWAQQTAEHYDEQQNQHLQRYPPSPDPPPHREREERFAQLLRINREVERGRLAGRGVTDLQQQLLSEEQITVISVC